MVYSLFDNGGVVGKEVSLYATTYDESISGTSGGSPTFRWTLNNTTAEAGGLGSTVNGSFSYGSGLIPSISQNSAIFNGTDSYLTPVNDPLINTGTGYAFTKRSVSFWFNADTTSSWRTVWEQGGGANWMSIYLQNNALYANVGEGSVSGGHATAVVVPNKTYHCLVVFDLTLGSNNIKIYINGQLAGQANSSIGGDLAEHTGVPNLGFGNARNHESNNSVYTVFDGRIQDFCYWFETALTPTDAQNIYNTGTDTRSRSGIYNLSAVSGELL